MLAAFDSIGGAFQIILGISFLSMTFEVPLFNGALVFKPWRLFLLMSSLVSGLCWLAFMFLPESPKFLLTLRRHDEALNVLKSIYRINKKVYKNEMLNDEFCDFGLVFV